jgi:Xaa-Pro aminopeptidase
MVRRKRIRRLGYEPAWLNVDAFSRLKEGLKASLVSTAGLVEQHRAIKSASEIEKIRKSVAVNSEAYSRTLKRIKIGVRELDIAAELDYQMRRLGAEKSAFDTIVASGARTALPHAHPTLARIAANELLLIDMGATLDGYASDMTRVSFLGTPSGKVKRMYRAVLEAQLAGVEAVRPGVTAGQVDHAARNVLKKYKLEEAFVHSTGHGLGLEIHEGPRIAAQDKSKLRPGLVITIEPGAYVEGFGGIRIEDTVLVTNSGYEILTPTSKEFTTL